MPTSHQAGKRILFFNLYSEMGGGEYAVYYLVRDLDKSRFHPIMAFNKRGPFSEKVESLGIETSILAFPSVMLKRLIRPRVLRSAIKASREISRYLRANNIDTIYCSDVVFLLMAALPAIRYKIPVVYSVIFFYEPARIVLFNLLALFCVKKILTNSRSVERYLVDRTLWLSGKVETVYQGVDTELFRPRKNGEALKLRMELAVKSGTILVGMVGRFDPSKGHKVFLRSAVSVLRRRNDIQFVAVGGLLNDDVVPSLRSYRDEIVRYANELGLGSRMAFVPHRDDMPEVLRSLDLLVCPSVSEGFGLTILEGLASGLPVVVSRSAGAFEVVAGMKGVFAAETDDPESFAARILDALDTNASNHPADLSSYSWKEYSRSFERVCASFEDEQ